jgi:hypothetical protein
MATWIRKTAVVCGEPASSRASAARTDENKKGFKYYDFTDTDVSRTW